MRGMTFPLGSLRADGAAVSAQTLGAAPRWRQQLMLLLGGVAWLLLALAMVTHHGADPAFTTSGSGEALHNKAGLLGARIADLLYFLFGFSAWWLLPVGARAWLSSRAGLLRSEAEPAAPERTPRWMFWLGLALSWVTRVKALIASVKEPAGLAGLVMNSWKTASPNS